MAYTEPTCWMCRNEYCMRCTPTRIHCEHDSYDRHIDTDGVFVCDDDQALEDPSRQAKPKQKRTSGAMPARPLCRISALPCEAAAVQGASHTTPRRTC